MILGSSKLMYTHRWSVFRRKIYNYQTIHSEKRLENKIHFALLKYITSFYSHLLNPTKPSRSPSIYLSTILYTPYSSPRKLARFPLTKTEAASFISFLFEAKKKTKRVKLIKSLTKAQPPKTLHARHMEYYIFKNSSLNDERREQWSSSQRRFIKEFHSPHATEGGLLAVIRYSDEVV